MREELFVTLWLTQFPSQLKVWPDQGRSAPECMQRNYVSSSSSSSGCVDALGGWQGSSLEMDVHPAGSASKQSELVMFAGMSVWTKSSYRNIRPAGNYHVSIVVSVDVAVPHTAHSQHIGLGDGVYI